LKEKEEVKKEKEIRTKRIYSKGSISSAKETFFHSEVDVTSRRDVFTHDLTVMKGFFP
jgi:hypothetical protein